MAGDFDGDGDDDVAVGRPRGGGDLQGQVRENDLVLDDDHCIEVSLRQSA